MADLFEGMVDAAQAFFPELAQNNTKDWFEPRKAHYQSEILKPAKIFADEMATDLAHLTGTSLKPKVFRIYRDVRFSKDKSPLNAHLHLSWSAPEPTAPTWFWGLSPSYFIVGMGFMGFDSDGLRRFRALVDSDGDDLTDAMEDAQRSVGAELSSFGPEPLKRVPKPFEADHPHADLLKRKSFALHAPMPDTWRNMGLLKAVRHTCEGLMPVYRVLMR